MRQVFVKGWREVVKNDNLDWGLLKRGWVRAWTQQPRVKEHKTYWKANAPSQSVWCAVLLYVMQ